MEALFLDKLFTEALEIKQEERRWEKFSATYTCEGGGPTVSALKFSDRVSRFRIRNTYMGSKQSKIYFLFIRYCSYFLFILYAFST